MQCILMKGGNFMSTLLNLGIGNMELDWGKNMAFNNFSELFQVSDIKMIPYYYLDSDDIKREMKEGYSKKLSDIKERLNMLGYTLDKIEIMYKDMVKEFERMGYQIILSYENFFSILYTLDIPKINTLASAVEYEANGFDIGEYVRVCIFPSLDFLKKCTNSEFELSYFLESIDSNIILRILAENKENKDYEIQWRFLDAIENGWITREALLADLSIMHKILIVTEGSSDSFILKRTIDALYPNISDFFDFVDMDKNYPFTGTGSLYNFCEGLCRINIQNNMIVIFDNDTAGMEKYHKSKKLNKPDTLIIIKLPDLEVFMNIPTIGPQGESIENINGRAVAIECFLDFDSVKEETCIRWSSYNQYEGEYQGALIDKDKYVRSFKRCNLLDGSYNTTKLKYLVNYIVEQWINR